MYNLRWTEGYPPGIAQMVERLTVDQLVTCSNQVARSLILRTRVLFSFKFIEL